MQRRLRRCNHFTAVCPMPYRSAGGIPASGSPTNMPGQWRLPLTTKVCVDVELGRYVADQGGSAKGAGTFKHDRMRTELGVR